MRQEAFRAAGLERWNEIQRLMDALDRRRTEGAERFPLLYRRLCHDLAVARDRHFEAPLVERLNVLAHRGQQHLYRTQTASLGRIARFFRVAFPRSVRAQGIATALCALLFFGMAALMGLGVQREPSLIYAVLSPDQVGAMEEMYDPSSETFLNPISSDSRFAMFGYYVMNNVGVCLRTFAAGLLFGVGSIVVLVSNGGILGALAGHLSRVGHGETFFRFVTGHAGPELLAVILAAVAGLRLGWALVSAGPDRRSVAIKRAARGTLPLVYGCVALLLVAASIEAFWSPYPFPTAVKYAVGGALVALLVAYLGLCGRRHGA